MPNRWLPSTRPCQALSWSQRIPPACTPYLPCQDRPRGNAGSGHSLAPIHAGTSFGKPLWAHNQRSLIKRQTGWTTRGRAARLRTAQSCGVLRRHGLRAQRPQNGRMRVHLLRRTETAHVHIHPGCLDALLRADDSVSVHETILCIVLGHDPASTHPPFFSTLSTGLHSCMRNGLTASAPGMQFRSCRTGMRSRPGSFRARPGSTPSEDTCRCRQFSSNLPVLSSAAILGFNLLVETLNSSILSHKL